MVSDLLLILAILSGVCVLVGTVWATIHVFTRNPNNGSDQEKRK